MGVYAARDDLVGAGCVAHKNLEVVAHGAHLNLGVDGHGVRAGSACPNPAAELVENPFL